MSPPHEGHAHEAPAAPSSATTASGGEAGAGAARRQTALMRRLAKIKDHADYPAAMAHVPPSEEDLERAATMLRRGVIATALGVAFVLLGVADVVGSVWSLVVAIPAIAAGGHWIFHGWRVRAKTLEKPLVRACALVADRRSETAPTWLGGRTVYYFQLQLEDGTGGEYRYPGRGTQDDLLVKGLTGVAFLRGDTLIAWKNIRV